MYAEQIALSLSLSLSLSLWSLSRGGAMQALLPATRRSGPAALPAPALASTPPGSPGPSSQTMVALSPSHPSSSTSRATFRHLDL